MQGWGNSKSGSKGQGKGKGVARSEDAGGAGRVALELDVLKSADLFQADGPELAERCLGVSG